MENIEKVIQHYISVFKPDSPSISPPILNYFSIALEKYNLEEILQAINLSFEELKNKKGLHQTQILKVLQKNLEAIAGLCQTPPSNTDSNHQQKSDDNTTNEKHLEKEQTGYQFGAWKNFFKEHQIPKNIITKKEIERIPPDLRDFYIAKVVCDYLYTKLPDKERERIDKLIQNKIENINISQDIEKEEIKELLKRYYIKKLYHIPY